MKALYVLFMYIGTVISVIACDNVYHPLDDSESRPTTAQEAIAEATTVLDDIADTTLAAAPYDVETWVAESGCATHPDSPEQGDVSRILYRTYSTLPKSGNVDSLLAEQRERWESQGYTVQENASNQPATVMTRPHGITYYLIDHPPGVQLRAYLPCYTDAGS